MRFVFVGAGNLAVMAAKTLLRRGNEVVLIDLDKARIDALGDELDAGFLHGDGSKPAILREADPEATDMLFCVTDNDQVNILASLVGRSLGFDTVVTRVEDPEFEHICVELGLDNTIIPDMTTAQYLADITRGQDLLRLSTLIRGEARLVSFIAREEDTGEVGELGLPTDARVVCLYRDEEFILADAETGVKKDDELVILTRSSNLPALREHWQPPTENG